MKCYILLFLIYSIFGTILHFTFKLSKNNIVVGIISAVNESVWEHIKLLLTPIFIYSFINSLINKTNNYFVLLLELVLSIVLIIIFYELKLIIFKDKKGYLNIISFYVVCFIVSFTHCYLKSITFSNYLNNISLIFSLIIFIMYLTFTIFPLKNKYFKDPITGKYGINEFVNKSV